MFSCVSTIFPIITAGAPMKRRLLFLLPAVLPGVACLAQETATFLPAGALVELRQLAP
jgi:hypothetical protein